MCHVRRKSHILFAAFLSTVLCGIGAYLYAFNIFIGTRSSSALPLQFLKKIKMLSGKPLSCNPRFVHSPKCRILGPHPPHTPLTLTYISIEILV